MVMQQRGSGISTSLPAAHECEFHPWLPRPDRRAQGTESGCPCLDGFVPCENEPHTRRARAAVIAHQIKSTSTDTPPARNGASVPNAHLDSGCPGATLLLGCPPP